MQFSAPAFPPFGRCLLILIGISLFFGYHADGEVPDTRFINHTTRHGLPHNTIRAITKDRDGFLWIGTKNGLSRFDGLRFKNFYYNPNDSNSISGNDIVSLYCDSKGFIWISTLMNGLNRYNPFTGKFERFIYDETDTTSLGGLNPMEVIEDVKGQIWICIFGRGINRFIEKNKTFERIRFEKQPKAYYHFDECSRTALDSKGMLWITTRVGLVRFNPETREFKKISREGSDPTINIFTDIHIDKSGMIWLGTYKSGLISYHPQTGVWLQYLNKPDIAMQNNIFWDIASYSDTKLYITSAGGGFGLFDIHDKTFSFFRNESYNYYSFPGNDNAHCVYKNGQQVFVGSDYGLSIITPSSNMFKWNSCYDRSKEDTTLSMISVIIPQVRDSIIYLGTYYRSGLYEYHLRKGITNRYQSPGINYPEHIYDVLPSLSSDKIWLLATVKGLKAFDINKKRIILPENLPGELLELLRDKFLTRLYRSRNNQLWIGGHGLLIQFDENTLKFRDYTKIVHEATGKKIEKLFDIYEDYGGTIRVCVFPHKMISIDPLNGSVVTGFSGKTGVINLPGEPRQILQDLTGNFWFGLYGAGIGFYNADKDMVRVFSRQEGLAGVGFISMFVNHDGKIWTNSEYGITIFDPTDYSTANLTERNGLRTGLDFNMHLQKDGTVILSTYDALSFFRPDDLFKNPSAPEVEISAFRIFDDDYVTNTSINHIEEIKLSYHQNYFTIEFTSASYDNPEGITYSYMLEGVDPNWIHNGSGNTVSYTNIDGGTYYFKVKARSGAGIWSTKEKGLKITIVPPFWKTPWFMILAGTLVLFLTFVIISIRIRNIKKQELAKSEHNKRIAELEMTALRAQMNPHFIFNCLNSINRYILKSDRDTAAEYVTKFSRLIRLILDNSRNNIVSLSDEISALKLYIEMETMRFENKFKYLIEISPEIETDKTMVPPMIFQPYVENAIWHGLMHKDGPGKIEIKVRKDKEYLFCTIDDNGVGRKRAGEMESKFSVKNKSHGLMVTAKRLTIYNQQENMRDEITIIDKVDSHGVPNGTKVVMKILIKENEL